MAAVAQVELLDETRLLSEVRPFRPILKVVLSKGRDDHTTKIATAQINVLLGKGASFLISALNLFI